MTNNSQIAEDNNPLFSAISNVVNKLVKQVEDSAPKWTDIGHAASFEDESDEQRVPYFRDPSRQVVITFSAHRGAFEVEPKSSRTSHELVLTVEQWKDKLETTFKEIGIGSDNDSSGKGGQTTLETNIKDVVSILDRNVVFEFNADDISLEEHLS